MTNLTFGLDERIIILILILVWHYIEISFNAMYIQLPDFKCVNLFYMVKNNFILPTKASLQNYFPLNISNMYMGPHNKNKF